MTEQPNSDLRERARRALERTLRTDAPPPDQPPDPELLARVETAVQSLPRRRRAIFLAVCCDKMPYGEIAKETGLSVEQIKRHVARALLQIDDRLRRGEASPSRAWWQRFLRR